MGSKMLTASVMGSRVIRPVLTTSILSRTSEAGQDGIGKGRLKGGGEASATPPAELMGELGTKCAMRY